MKYFKKFDNLTSANGYQINDIPFIGVVYSGNDEFQKVYCDEPGKKIEVINGYANVVDKYPGLKFKSNGQTTISLSRYYNHTPDLKYSTDFGETWTSWTNQNYNPLQLNDGQSICFKGNNPSGFSYLYYDEQSDEGGEYECYSTFTFQGSGTISASGNIMSLIDDGACTTTVIPCDWCFMYLFYTQTKLISAPELPATTLAESCYQSMFSGCTSLIKAPELPATTLANQCYCYMFYNCQSLISGPSILPATILKAYCYYYMFFGCTSLIKAPEIYGTDLTDASYCCSYMFYNCQSLISGPSILPATILKAYCYYCMFYGCTSLVNAPILPATNLTNANYCYYRMFYGCTSLIKAPEISAITLTNANYCYQYMFFGCTSLSIGPSTLPATTLAAWCYSYMFYGCTSLIKAPALPATTLANYCYQYMFYNCRSLVNAPILPATNLTNAIYCYQYMFYNCTSLINVSDLPATILSQRCYSRMFYGCKSLTTAPEISANNINNATNCCEYMFQNCTSLTTPPSILPAATLANSCYQYMFQNCTSLTSAPALPAATLANSCYRYMFNGCTSLTSAPELPATTLTNYCYRYMFNGCSKLSYVKCLATNTSAPQCMTAWLGGVSEYGIFVKSQFATVGSGGTFNKDWGNSIYTFWNIENYYENPDVVFTPDTSFSTNNVVTLKVKNNNSIIQIGLLSSHQTLYISTDKEHWMTLHDGNRLTVNAGEIYYICGTLTGDNSSIDFTNIKLLGRIGVSGNINSIWNYSNPNASLTYGYCGYLLFAQSTGLENNGIKLPSMSVPSNGYWGMFMNCTRMKTPPELPATTLTGSCYYNMFQHCTHLKHTPQELPALTVPGYSYVSMFKDCTSLTTIFNQLPATTLGERCYNGMFTGCTSLSIVPSQLLPATTLYNGCYRLMFKDCTHLESSPDLLATTLVNECYYQMFIGCKNLHQIKCLATSGINSTNLSDWVSGVATIGIFRKASYASWPTGNNGIPSGWTTQNVA